MRPGVNVTVRDTIPPRSQPTDVDTWFVAGITERGSLSPVLVRSMAEFEDEFGTRQSWTPLWDAMDVFFREGGSKAYVARVVGPAATTASLTLSDGVDNTVTVSAKAPGAWAHDYDVAVVTSGAGIKLQIVRESDSVVVEESPTFTTKAAMAEWTTSDYVTITLLGTGNLPAVAAAADLTGGDDDRDAITAAHYKIGLDKFVKDYGPGQVSIPGQTDATTHGNLLDHAAAFNRFALLDAQDSGTAATLISAADSLGASTNARYGMVLAPWVTVPGVVVNTTRRVPYSAVQAGMMARQANPNQAVAGEFGESRYAISAAYAFTDTERGNLNSAGVNIARNILGRVRTYGYRTLADPDTQKAWVQASSVRTVMQIRAEAEAIGERHMFAQIDGRGLAFAAFGGDLKGMLIRHYNDGALYGDTVEEAFAVDTGSQVNTPATIADGQMRAVISLRTSPFAEQVNIEIVKYQLPSFDGTVPIIES